MKNQRVADLSRTQLYNRFSDTIRQMVRSISGGFGQTLDDRIQSAWIEFLRCADACPELTIDAFVPRAMARVRGAILDEMRADDPMSRNGRMQAKKLNAAAHAISGRTGQKATALELADELGLSVTEVHDMLYRVHTQVFIYSIDDIQENQIAQFTENVLDGIISEERVQQLLDAIESLPERDREVVELRYYQGLTNREIAKKLQIGESRATELHQRGVAKLRKALLTTAAA